jgi:dihydrolipoamide dehydrogenase
VPVELPQLKFDHAFILDSWDALDLTEVPKRLAVIGAGVIGLELGSVWHRLGAEVTLVEAMEQFLPMADRQLANDALKQFKKQGLDIRLGAKVTGATVQKNKTVAVTYTAPDGSSVTLDVDKVIVAVGRRAQTAQVLSSECGVAVNARGVIEVNDHCETSVAGVYAVGDCVRGAMLAHKGKEEGVMVADRIAGLYGHVNYKAIPSVIYTHPEMAWVGINEEEAEKAGRATKVGVFPFMASGRARAMEAGDGFVKVIAAKDNDELLGVHIMGPMAGELIAEAVLAMEYSASAEDLQRTMHAHPTLSEALHEAALLVDGLAIDYPNKPAKASARA